MLCAGESRSTKFRRAQATVKSWFSNEISEQSNCLLDSNSKRTNALCAQALQISCPSKNNCDETVLKEHYSVESPESDTVVQIAEKYSVLDWDRQWDYDSASISSDDSDSALNHCDDSELGLKLAEWVNTSSCTHNDVDRLLNLLHLYHPHLPLTCRTLLKSKSCINIKRMDSGEYAHFGILRGILPLCKKLVCTASSPSVIKYQVCVDGLPLFKSSSTQLWPILGRVTEMPFIIGMYCGASKPSNAADYLNDFIKEAIELSETGFDLDNKHFTASIDCFICDAPARAFLKQVKSHTGYDGCERCTQRGIYVQSRMTYPETRAVKRTDELFKANMYDSHQVSVSPLLQLGIGLVSGFVLDYMHLACLGVVRRLLIFWTRGSIGIRLSAATLSLISDNLLHLRHRLPVEFVRKPRSLVDIDRWKATEFRQFLLYTGMFALKALIPIDKFVNFLCLSVAMRLLLSPSLCQCYCSYAEELLIHFVTEAETLYGQEFTVYNVHSLIHLPDDVRRFGNLNCISSFPFENYMHQIKKSVKKPQFVLQQIERRIDEGYFNPSCLLTTSVKVNKEHSQGPILRGLIDSKQYTVLTMANFILKTTEPNNCISYLESKIGLIRNIFSNGTVTCVLVQRFTEQQSYFTHPLPSCDIGIYLLRNLSSSMEVVDIHVINHKYILFPLPNNDHFLGIPLVH